MQQPKTTRWQKILCAIFNIHQLRIYREVTEDIREIECEICKKKWASWDGTDRFVPLSDELRQMHDDIIMEDLIKG